MAVIRDPQGKFTGWANPGRAPGATGRTTTERNALANSGLSAVQATLSPALRKLREAVEAGEAWAIKLVIQYCLPSGRTIDLGGTVEPNALIEAATSGLLSPQEFATMANGWKTAADAADLADLKHQVEQLELLVSSLRKS